MSKSCALKGQQQTFIFQRGLASSCCRAQPESLVKFVDLKALQDHWAQEAQQLTAGVELPGCQHCWDYEDQGLSSYRLQSIDANFHVFALFFSNLCNQMCSYCGPNYSSEWQQSFEKNGPFDNVSSNIKYHQLSVVNNESVDVESWLIDLKEHVNSLPNDSVLLTLLGGEPLMQSRNLEILQEFNLEKIKYVGVTTNLNPPNSKFLHQLFEVIPSEKIQLTISIDATPEYNHIPRSGFDKNRFLENLNFLIEKNARNSTLVCVASVLGILDLPNYIKWIDGLNLGFEWEINPVNNPECLHPKYLPNHIKQEILNQCQGLDAPKHIVEILTQEQAPVDHIIKEQYNYLIQYFTRAGIDPEQVKHNMFVQYWTWLKDYNENRTGI